MIIGIAGPYSAPTEEQRARNLDALNDAAAQLLASGHTPVIGANAALPVVKGLPDSKDRYQAIMRISLAVMRCCEALLIIAESPGALRERDLFQERGLPVYSRIEDVPAP